MKTISSKNIMYQCAGLALILNLSSASAFAGCKEKPTNVLETGCPTCIKQEAVIWNPNTNRNEAFNAFCKTTNVDTDKCYEYGDPVIFTYREYPKSSNSQCDNGSNTCQYGVATESTRVEKEKLYGVCPAG